jgi:hypothetical protein
MDSSTEKSILALVQHCSSTDFRTQPPNIITISARVLELWAPTHIRGRARTRAFSPRSEYFSTLALSAVSGCNGLSFTVLNAFRFSTGSALRLIPALGTP